ncbi:exoribonuclease complex, subunit Rrp44/Dis3 [Aspergillus steynii IBT 23096]|uniref:Exoribonuclease complex, subunit Rrp44/Dis3 n=1 Tax=Aspergillus steynii IBT 23096 TaxID=1392250 RepID=A0A2I2GF96_9EURO|nr:exoribonuclease complex, subunit Rrp44/Dis3 [Aspergillus steynii IBT 23096]PLB51552.1 exoribonuclease complex, subunit Rrp44/Dis3 [Aspergillus steynii IBT 23096]
MSFNLLRSRNPPGVAGLSLSMRHGSSVLSIRRASPFSLCACTRLLSSRATSRRYLSSEATNNSPTSSDSPKPLASIDDIRLKTEFEENKDIRDYLRKWQDTHSNALDPVRGPQTSNAGEVSSPWIGNMMNDQKGSDDMDGDALQAADEDALEFDNLADEGDGVGDFLEPGDLVALSLPDGMLSFAVYVRSMFKQQQFYTLRGKWRVADDRDIEYVIKGFAPRELVTPLYPHFPDNIAQLSRHLQSTIEGGVPRPVGAPLLRMVNAFDEQVQEVFQTYSNQLVNMHDTVADENDKMEFTLEELACRALGVEKDQLTDATLCAVHRVACRNQFIIAQDRSSLFSDHYLVQPKRVAQTLETVTAWVRAHQEYLIRLRSNKALAVPIEAPMLQFIQKAQRLIRLSRKVRSPTIMGSVGPTATRFQPGEEGKPMAFRQVSTEQFNSNDRIIIEFLQLWALPTGQMNSGVLRSTGSHIMRSTGMYDGLDLTAATAPLFLQEIGAIAPWENLRLLDQSVALPGHGISPSSDAAWADVQEACKKLKSDGVEDTMQNARTDWGDLPVYCIDNPDAQEIDDGVSLERIPGSDDTFWIRTHIANPSAFIDSNHSIMEYAASRVQTLYTPERTYPMLPESLTRAHFSLAPNRPALTFSAKMNLKGEVLETDVSNGTVRNVIYITHHKLRDLFEPDGKGHVRTLEVGGGFQNEPPRKNMRETLSPEDEDNFHTLRNLMLAFREHRRKNGAMEWPTPIDTPVSMTAGLKPLAPYNMRVNEGHYTLGDPVIRLHQRDVDPHEVPDLSKRDLVSLLMNLACWVSATWCAERNIPVIYDGTHYHPEYPHLTNNNINKFGGQSWFQLAAPKGMSSSSPSHHVPLGLDAYVKSTSPLRRYTDLLAHYQIEAALRFENKHGRRFDATADESILPFSREYVDNYIDRSRWKRNRLRNIDRGSKQFWGCMLLFRAFYFVECKLPESFKCLVHKPFTANPTVGPQSGQVFAGVITSLGLRCQILAPAELADIDILSVVEAKIIQVDLSRLLVIMEATRVVKPFERVGEWR